MTEKEAMRDDNIDVKHLYRVTYSKGAGGGARYSELVWDSDIQSAIDQVTVQFGTIYVLSVWQIDPDVPESYIPHTGPVDYTVTNR